MPALLYSTLHWAHQISRNTGRKKEKKNENAHTQNENQHKNDEEEAEVGNNKSNEVHRRRRIRRQTKKVDLLLVDA